MKKKFAVSTLVLTLACSSILCFGQEQKSAKKQPISKAIPVSHLKMTRKKDANEVFKAVDDKKLTSSSPIRGNLPQQVQEQSHVNQQTTLPILDEKDQAFELPVTTATQEVAQVADAKTTNNGEQVNRMSQTPEVATLPALQTLMPLPVASIGTWTVQVEPDWLVTITVSADGTVSRVDQSETYTYYSQPQSVHFNGVYDRGNGNYELVGDYGTNQAIMIIGGIGGANIKYTFGMHLDGNSLIPVLWQTDIASEFDFASPLSGPTLRKP
ncbi:hypothetical protein ABG810_07530 [Streptococcus iniae]